MKKEQVIKSGIFSPGLIGGEKIFFLKCDKDTFYLKHGEESPYLKDDKGKYVKMGFDDVVEARLSYLSTYFEQEKQEAVDFEYSKLTSELMAKANKKLAQMEFTIEAADDEGSIGFALAHANGRKITVTDEERESCKYLRQLIEAKQYDLLDIAINGFGNPMASFSIKDGADQTALLNLFHKDNLDKTLETKAEKGGIMVKAMANVEKRYYPQ